MICYAAIDSNTEDPKSSENVGELGKRYLEIKPIKTI